jgi:hypothetical protein
MNTLEPVPDNQGALYKSSGFLGERANRYERALSRLDELSDTLGVSDVVDVVGVLADIKPTAIVDDTADMEQVIDELGLYACVYYDDMNSSLLVSKSETSYQELARTLTESGGESRMRNIGRLLGYPRTATDYFIARGETLDGTFEQQLPLILPRELVGTPLGELHPFVYSPDHWREEVESYTVPLAAAVSSMTPLTYDTLCMKAEITNMAFFGAGVLRLSEVSQELPGGYKMRVKYVG